MSSVDDPDLNQAKAWIRGEIEQLRAASYETLITLEGTAQHEERTTVTGRLLGLDTQIFWDDRDKETLRVLVDVWDPTRVISTSIASESFIRLADGSFVGE